MNLEQIESRMKKKYNQKCTKETEAQIRLEQNHSSVLPLKLLIDQRIQGLIGSDTMLQMVAKGKEGFSLLIDKE